jgi:hypothetical protein
MSGNRVYVAEIVMDFSVQNMSAAQTAKLMIIPAKTLLLEASYEVKTEEGATLTADVGDSSIQTLIADNIDCNDDTVHGQASLGAPRYYASADYIQLLCNNNSADAAVLVVKLLMVDMSDSRDSY